MKINPFEKLGIAPILVEELDNENLARIVEVQHRELQRIYHPDAEGGITKKSAELSEAYTLIKNPNSESFAEAKRGYLKTKGKSQRARELEERLKAEESINKQLSDVFMMYALNFAGLADNKQPNIFYHDDLLLKVSDTVLLRNLNYIRLPKNKQAEFTLRQLKLKKNGDVYEKSGKGYNKTDKRTIGSIPLASWNIVYNVLYNVGERNMQLIGSKPRTIDEVKIYRKVPLGDFKMRLLPYLTPNIAEDHYLFTAQKTDTVEINIEGKIVKIEKI